MQFFPGFSRAHLLVFAAQVVVAGGIFFGNAVQPEAASRPPATPPDPTPIGAVFENPIPSDRLSFLNDYAGHRAKEALKDKRLHALLKAVIPRTEYHYGRDMPLDDASETVLSGSSLPVVVRDGRYVMVTGREGPYLDGQGFLWFDMKEGIALGGVYFHPVNGEPTPTLAIFSKQLKQNSLGMSELPLAFAEDLSEWTAAARVPVIAPRYFIPANGKKYVLLHDEDFCDHPENAPAPPVAVCEQMNADAADVDLNAAAFMEQTHNAANATAWDLSPELRTWIDFRDRTCLAGPNMLGCRIRMTRQRIRVLLGRH